MAIISTEGLAEAQEPQTLPSGTEVELQILSYEERESDSGGYAMVRLGIINHPLSEFLRDITYNVWEPREDSTPKQKNAAKWRKREFLEAFGMSITDDDFDSNELIGRTTFAAINETDSPEYGKQNNVRKWMRQS